MFNSPSPVVRSFLFGCAESDGRMWEMRGPGRGVVWMSEMEILM